MICITLNILHIKILYKGRREYSKYSRRPFRPMEEIYAAQRARAEAKVKAQRKAEAEAKIKAQALTKAKAKKFDEY